MDKRELWEKCNNDFHKQLADNETIERHHDYILSSYLAAKEYAQLIIKSLILLNAGALAALPVIYEALGLEDPQLLMNSAPKFIVSLCLIIVTGFLAYLNLQYCAKNIEKIREQDRHIYLQRHFAIFFNKDTMQDLSDGEEKAKKWVFVFFVITKILEFFAIIAAIASVIYFIWGAFLLTNLEAIK